jgi:hypothetical protein
MLRLYSNADRPPEIFRSLEDLTLQQRNPIVMEEEFERIGSGVLRITKPSYDWCMDSHALAPRS